MPFTPAPPASLAAFVLIVAAVLGTIVVGVYVAHRRLGLPAGRRTAAVHVGLLVWVALTSIPVATGLLAASPMPRIPLYFAAINLAAVAFAFSRLGRALTLGLPLAALVAFQAFRLPLEFVLHGWADRGVIPPTMTWTGQNFDIVTGLLALLLAPFANRSHTVAWAFNLIGLALLLNVMRVAMMSSPLPFAWPNVCPPLQLVLHLPHAWIGSVCVASALAGHIVLTRALLARRAA
ncbi:MAG TPA: hypothetical protein VEA69_20810 [Tepidisphaeraceae bacterium]|nr:hypothetical protein [Tepidisphaeraceae bacterium]